MSGRPWSTPWTATRWDTTRGALARSSSAASGFFFCGMRLDPELKASSTSQKPNSWLDQSTISRAELRQVGRAGGGGREVVQHEIPVRHRVQRVLRDSPEAQLLSHEHPARVEVHPGQRARAERQVIRGGEAEVEALEIAAELPEVRQQVMREVDGLGPLQVGVAGERPVEVALGQPLQGPHQPEHQDLGLEGVSAHEHGHVGGHLVVARAGGVQLAPHRPGDLGEPALDRHVHVLVARLDHEAVLVDLRAHGLQALLDPGQVLVRDDPAPRQHPGVRERLLEVVRRQPEVERDRRVQRLEQRVLRISEAAHRPPV